MQVILLHAQGHRKHPVCPERSCLALACTHPRNWLFSSQLFAITHRCHGLCIHGHHHYQHLHRQPGSIPHDAKTCHKHQHIGWFDRPGCGKHSNVCVAVVRIPHLCNNKFWCVLALWPWPWRKACTVVFTQVLCVVSEFSGFYSNTQASTSRIVVHSVHLWNALALWPLYQSARLAKFSNQRCSSTAFFTVWSLSFNWIRCVKMFVLECL